MLKLSGNTQKNVYKKRGCYIPDYPPFQRVDMLITGNRLGTGP